ncbi:SDR family NAD(P)-dependent oxidoreductase [Hoeflea sp. YIM 152468]|uniref:SDR family NAD(P)-dependent oxidoreductase n=1 Tax=Hoeflea sp. YIM 152468 TaxID=3031759 RepID=UPI0023DA7C39|nr:SDR family NAD(P)-dependent oxidoreductase [Hoeflea sp. YIM 152468]MDF1606782.1 SDR family NAD(P)-dependent oxidoreductase [Hoeflea sp. YIM 152468]
MSGPIRRALVTGGSAGLGAAMAEHLLGCGYEVVSLDRNRPCAGAGPVLFIQCELGSRSELDRVMPEVIEAGPYDLVLLNTGINATGAFETVSSESHQQILRVNAEAPMVMASRLLTERAFTPSAALVFVSSLSFFTGYPGAASYAASKDALSAYAASMRKTAKARGISITTAYPGPIRTDHAERHAPAGADATRRMDPGLVARLIIADAVGGRKTSIPGGANRVFALIGRIAPKPVTALMRRGIYVRLK